MSIYSNIINQISNDIKILEKNIQEAKEENNIERILAIKTELSIQLSNREYWIKKEIERIEKLKQSRERREYWIKIANKPLNTQYNYVPAFLGGCVSGGPIGGLAAVGIEYAGITIHRKLVGDGNINDNYKNYLNNFNQSYVIKSDSYITNFKN